MIKYIPNAKNIKYLPHSSEYLIDGRTYATIEYAAKRLTQLVRSETRRIMWGEEFNNKDYGYKIGQ